MDTPRAKRQSFSLPPSQNLLRAGHAPLECIFSMASPAVREPIDGPVLEVWHVVDGPAAHWRALLGGGDAVDGARNGCCVLCDEQRPTWHHEARSEVSHRDLLHAALRAAGRRATGNDLLRDLCARC